ncbi:uncharacterized protein [Antedon mediterranea]|uniref:uncharacterized protein n=1 Tax=Antedon mediterranea TaxID=105859 RepID=UPI003AF6E048
MTSSRPNNLELHVFRSPSEKFSINGISPPSPNTPTICLSSPKKTKHSNGFSFPSKINHGFVQDDELNLEYGHPQGKEGWDIPGLLDTASMSSMLSLPTATVAGALALSPGTRSLQTVPRSQTQDTVLTCDESSTPHSGFNSSNLSLTIPPLPGMVLSKRHSFPLSDATPDLLSPRYTFKHQKSLDGLNCISKSFDMSSIKPLTPLSPLSPAWARKLSSISSSNSLVSSDGSFSIDAEESFKTDRFRQIFKTVATKANKLRQNKIHPEALEVPMSKKRKRLDSFAPSSCVEETALEVSFFSKKITLPKWLKRLKHMKSIDPAGSLWLAWLFIVAVAFVYNAVTIFLRGVFGYDNNLINEEKSFFMWLGFDLLFDLVYFLDIFLRMRIQFIHGGMYVEDKALTKKYYFSTNNFKLDVVCLLPFDLLSKIWLNERFMIFIRLPRLLKYHSYNEFVSRFESSSSFANAFRVGKMVSYLLYMIHLNTCCYYAISLYEGIGVNEWVYNNAENSNPYIRCMYRATKTLITIGNLPVPMTDLEIVFMNIDFAIGIFVFASIIGQMRDIVGAASATKERFRERMDNTMLLLKNWQIPEHVQKKVRMWYMYKWDSGELIDEADILSGVPLKMQTDIAIHVHMDTLTKVSLFQDCDKMLLRDLMLKLRAVLFLPGDFICRKGEVGKEMYIIKSGQVQVLGGGKVLATLHAGSVFGEISLLSLSGGNRRTADVYSPGYANLFVLDKKTLHETLVNYPEAQELLQKKANEILKKNEENGVGPKKKRRGKSLIAESILTADKRNTPRFFNAVLQVSRKKKLAATILKGGMPPQDESEDDDSDFNEMQNHKDSFTEENIMKNASGEPNVIVHQPSDGVVPSEGSQGNTGNEESTNHCELPDQEHIIVVKENVNPSNKIEQSNISKIGDDHFKLEQPITAKEGSQDDYGKVKENINADVKLEQTIVSNGGDTDNTLTSNCNKLIKTTTCIDLESDVENTEHKNEKADDKMIQCKDKELEHEDLDGEKIQQTSKCQVKQEQMPSSLSQPADPKRLRKTSTHIDMEGDVVTEDAQRDDKIDVFNKRENTEPERNNESERHSTLPPNKLRKTSTHIDIEEDIQK